MQNNSIAVGRQQAGVKGLCPAHGADWQAGAWGLSTSLQMALRFCVYPIHSNMYDYVKKTKFMNNIYLILCSESLMRKVFVRHLYAFGICALKNYGISLNIFSIHYR